MKKNQLLKVDLNIPVAIIKEGKAYVAWTPALDLSTYGKTEYEAKKSFNEMVNIFFEEFADNPSGLEVVLEGLGWKKQNKKGWLPPKITNIQQNISVQMAV